MRKKVVHAERSAPERSTRDTIEGALFLFALTLLVVGTLGGIGLAGIAKVGCVGTE